MTDSPLVRGNACTDSKWPGLKSDDDRVDMEESERQANSIQFYIILAHTEIPCANVAF